ncbi:Histone-lysine N-methyltransferase, H3 lysine-9 specific protein [Thalictrum thalictroides]|uniref:Histone-lysine N-methyltransferase, H3 lysine-9 specific protein n=1 Tax=Thalictrum thalictroides TaxID=46969 RepID=A0A7J6W4Q2_THATH|nr:Histone-lysine N-methyltransferase, H3 lysine-9 specific protein [Thalictrum thalictroides]
MVEVEDLMESLLFDDDVLTAEVLSDESEVVEVEKLLKCWWDSLVNADVPASSGMSDDVNGKMEAVKLLECCWNCLVNADVPASSQMSDDVNGKLEAEKLLECWWNCFVDADHVSGSDMEREISSKRKFSNVDGDDSVMMYKVPKHSAERSFPEGCGRNDVVGKEIPSADGDVVDSVNELKQGVFKEYGDAGGGSVGELEDVGIVGELEEGKFVEDGELEDGKCIKDVDIVIVGDLEDGKFVGDGGDNGLFNEIEVGLIALDNGLDSELKDGVAVGSVNELEVVELVKDGVSRGLMNALEVGKLVENDNHVGFVYELEEGEIFEDGAADVLLNELDMAELIEGGIDIGSLYELEQGEFVEKGAADELVSQLKIGEELVDDGLGVGSINDLEEGEFIVPESFIQLGISANQKSEDNNYQVYVPTLEAKLSELGGHDDSPNEFQVKEGAFEEANFAEQLGTFSNQTFSENCEHGASQVNAKLSEEGLTRGSYNNSNLMAGDALQDPVFVKHSRSSLLSETGDVAETSVPIKLSHSVKDLTSETTKLLEVDQAGISELLNSLEHVSSDTLDLKESQPEEKELPILPDLIQLKEASFPLESIEGGMPQISFPRRRMSGRRDFPAGCGRIAMADVIGKCEYSGDHSLNRRMEHEKFSEKNRSKQIDKADAKERVVVQGLMSSSNCPWTQLKETFQHPVRNEHKYVVQNKSKSIFRKKKNENEDAKHFSRYDKPGNRVAKKSWNRDLSSIKLDIHTLEDNYDDIQASVARNKVRETLRLFQIICRKLMRSEEEKCKKGRVDLVSASILKEKNKWINTGNQILGAVPGVEVGDEFHYRVELSIIGLHRPYQSGIDYIKRHGKIVATSIVASGGYDDDICSSDVLIYSGQGGCPVRGVTTATDQKLVRGNLALKNSIDEGTPVRVIRGLKETNGHDSRVGRNDMAAALTYDGLYVVDKYWIQRGRYGTNVFMFQLSRIAGQPELAIKELKRSKKASIREGMCVNDISYGKEKIPIGAVNTITDERPPLFKYITKMIHPLSFNPTPHRGCECRDGCLSSMKCLCANKNGGQIPFNYDGAIVEAKALVYECGPSCRCPPSCYNRVSQHGIRFRLEIFKTRSRGWGVRSLSSIPSGSFICEYTGEFLQDREAEKRTGNDQYLFDVGHKYDDHALWEGLSNLIPSNLKSSSSCEAVEDVGYTIDAAQCGNVGRFINHSCSPNLYAQNVLYDHDDKRMPHIMLFAAENIPPLKELTYHYNMAVDQVYDSNGNIKKKNCYCGSLQCTGRLY